jgi:hypothetical protein
MEIYQIVKGCLVVELAVASIYSGFIHLFPQKKDFWDDLYKDERRHISFLIETSDSGSFDEMQTADLGFSMPLLERTQTFIANISNHIGTNPVSLEEALNMALQMEETKVEAFANELIANLSSADDEAFLQLLMEEKTHIAKIKNVMIEQGFLKLS